MISALFAGVSGLAAHQEMLDVVGNNLANLNTNGFKAQAVQFADLISQNLGGGGSTNPIQVGTGVRVASIGTNQQQGSLSPTGGQFDLGIQGNGYFVVNSPNGTLFTRAGSFGVDRNGFLSDPSTGYRVQRTGTVGEGSATSPAFQLAGSNDISIPLGTTIPGQATKTINLTGNLSASATGPAAQVLTSTIPFLSGGVAATSASTLNSLGDNTTPYVAGDSIRLQGTTSAGNTVNVTVPVGAATTLGDLITAINANFPDATATLNAGNLVVTANTVGASKLGLDVSDVAGNAGSTVWTNHKPKITTVGKTGDTVTSAIQIFDIQGKSHNLNLTLQKQTNNSWNLDATIPASDGTVLNGQVSGITFDDNGSFQSVSGVPQLSFQFNGLSAPQALAITLGTPGNFNGLTQFGGIASAAATNQDGFAAGSLTSTSIDRDGVINGVFTNGRTLALAQIAMASFTNPDGLSRTGNNYLSQTIASGNAQIGGGASGSRGTMQQGALESSNVDVSLEFTRLIIAQRGFQVNAKTISVADQVLQDLSNIIR